MDIIFETSAKSPLSFGTPLETGSCMLHNIIQQDLKLIPVRIMFGLCKWYMQTLEKTWRCQINTFVVIFLLKEEALIYKKENATTFAFSRYYRFVFVSLQLGEKWGTSFHGIYG